ncbi:hypothetical protein ACHQM5_007764 [Ranunculus cassubicifolius]
MEASKPEREAATATEMNGGEEDRNTKSSVQMQTKINLMRLLLQKRDPTAAKEVDDMTIRRFLRARDLDMTKASDLLLKYLKWKKEFMPQGFISKSEITYELSQNKAFMQGTDKTGRPLVVIFGGRHIPTKGKEGVEEFKRMMAYCLDKICGSMSDGHEKFVCIVDMEGWGYSTCDITGYVAGLSILQDCYPERLGKLYMVHVPYIFMAAWKIIYPFIDDNTRKKIVFVENKNLKQTLEQDIHEEHIPDIYGGELPLVPIQNY